MMFDVNSAPVIVNLGKPASNKVIVICCNLNGENHDLIAYVM